VVLRASRSSTTTRSPPTTCGRCAAATLGLAGNPSVEAALHLVDRRADSPMESRIRVALVLAGLPLGVATSCSTWPAPRRCWPSSTTAATTARRHRHCAIWSARTDHLGRLEDHPLDAVTVLGCPGLVVARTRAMIASRATVRAHRPA